MKYIKAYKVFEKLEDFIINDEIETPDEQDNIDYPSDKDEVEFDLERYDIYNYVVNDDLIVDVNEDVYLDDYRFHELPFYFNKIEGHFSARMCELKSLSGMPRFINGMFDVSFNDLRDYDIDYFPVAKEYNFGDNLFDEDVRNFINQEIQLVSDYGIWYDDGRVNQNRLKLYQAEFKGFN